MPAQLAPASDGCSKPACASRVGCSPDLQSPSLAPCAPPLPLAPRLPACLPACLPAVISYLSSDISQQGLLIIPCVVGQISQIFIGSALAKLFARQVKALHRQQAAAGGTATDGSSGDLKAAAAAAAAAAVAAEPDVELAEGSGKDADASSKLAGSTGSTGSFESLGGGASRASGESSPKHSSGAPGAGGVTGRGSSINAATPQQHHQ